MTTRLTHAERYQLLKFLEGVGQERIDTEGYTYIELAKKATKETGMKVSMAQIKKSLPLIGLRASQKQIRKTEAARANGTAMATMIRSMVETKITELQADLRKTDNVVKDIRIVLADVHQAVRECKAALEMLLDREKTVVTDGNHTYPQGR